MIEKMKILPNKIKRWSFKQRLFEIQRRLKTVKREYERNYTAHVVFSGELVEALDEAQQIADYWMKHMAGDIEKPEEKKTTKKPVNLWE